VIRVVTGELADSGAEAVLRPVSAEWTAVTPAMRRLELVAGPTVEAQCRTLGELPVSSAIITPAGDLAAHFMIHVIVRSRHEQVSEAGVRRALQNGLRRVAEWGIHHVAMPPLGTGAGNLDADDSAAIMIPVLLEQMLVTGAPAQVEVCVETEYERDAFERRLERELANTAAAGGPAAARGPAAPGGPAAARGPAAAAGPAAPGTDS
jgi:O-acetyl-ADP-ribose deacetylase (regulator of RNase III)